MTIYCDLTRITSFLIIAKIVSLTKQSSLKTDVKNANDIKRQRARSIQPKFRPVRPGKEDHLKRWTCFFETFPVGPNRSIEFWIAPKGFKMLKIIWTDLFKKHFFCRVSGTEGGMYAVYVCCFDSQNPPEANLLGFFLVRFCLYFFWPTLKAHQPSNKDKTDSKTKTS